MTFRQAVRFMFWSCEKRNSGAELTERDLDLYVEAWQVVSHFATDVLGLKPESWEYHDGKEFRK